MELDSDHLAVLGIFREHEIEIGECLATGAMSRARMKLPEAIQQNWGRAVGELTKQGYLSYHPSGYGLTWKGHDCISRRLDSQQPRSSE